MGIGDWGMRRELQGAWSGEHGDEGGELQNAFGWNLSGDFTSSAVLSRDDRYADTRRTRDVVHKAQTRHSNSIPPIPKCVLRSHSCSRTIEAHGAACGRTWEAAMKCDGCCGW